MLVCIVAFALTARAQTFFGSIVGTATDSSGAVVPAATVTLTNTGTAEQRTAQTDAVGNYSFVSLLPGSYSVTVSKTGFKQSKVDSIPLRVDQVVRADAILQVGESSQAVEVSASSALLQTQTSTIGQVVESKQVADLPLNGRNVLNLTMIVPGVVQEGGSFGNPVTNSVNAWGNYQIGGGIANQSGFYLDGAPVNISYCQMVALVPTQDAIQEFDVQSNNISPEFGKSAGGIVNMTTKSGTNDYHLELYEYLRNRDLNANLFVNNTAGISRPEWTQNQFGGTLGGPIKKDKTFAFLSWEHYDMHQAFPTLTTVPTPSMLAGNFTQAGVPQIFDPLTTCGTGGNTATCGTSNGSTLYARTPFPGNIIPTSRLNPTASILSPMLWPAATNPNAITNNFLANYPESYSYNQYTARIDQKIGEKQQLFGRFTYFRMLPTTTNPLLNNTSKTKYYHTDQAVFGDTILIDPTTVADLRASFIRYKLFVQPGSCCNFKYAQLGGNWASYQGNAQFSEMPMPNVAGMYNLNGVAFDSETDNDYALSGSLTKTLGRHTLKFGAEARRVEWSYFQSNIVGGTFNADSGFTSEYPLVGSGAGSPATTGFGFASWMLGFPSSGSAQEPALSFASYYYGGLFANDSFRVTNKLTLNLGLRWEQPGSFHERYDSLTAFLPNAPATALSQQTGLQNLQGILALTGSSQYPSRDWQNLHWKDFSPRVGFAYSLTNNWVIRGGYGILYLPINAAWALSPYNAPVNLATTTMTASLNGNLTPDLATTLSNPFPNGMASPPGHSQAYVNSLIGQGFQSPVPNMPNAYAQQWNLDVQRQIGTGLMVDASYAGARGIHLPVASQNIDALPDQYDSMGNALLTAVNNPFYGTIPTSAGVLGQSTVLQGYLLRPYPQYLYMQSIGPNIGDSYYDAFNLKVTERMKHGVLLVAYTWSKFLGTTDTQTPFDEGVSSATGGGAGAEFIGGQNGLQDNNNIKAEKSLEAFETPNRLVFSYVYDLPFGKGQKFLSGVHGVAGKLVSGWSINEITTFQTGFPLALYDSASNTLTGTFAAGKGVTRPNYVGGCNPVISGPATSRLKEWFNTSCFTAPGTFANGDEPRVDPVLRWGGVNNFDLSFSKVTQLTERLKLDFRAEIFNIFNRVQFGVPGEAYGTSSFGVMTGQFNQPRIVQFGQRLSY